MLESDRLANHVQDDGFHEIQLNGKQLVFLFMAATVVSVVIFLCGVLVGRGVRAERGGPIADASFSSAPGTGSAANSANVGNPPNSASSGGADSQPPQSPPVASDPTVAAPPPTVDDLTYFNRLEKQKPPREELKREDPKPRDQQKPLRAEPKPSTAKAATPAPVADIPAHAESRATAPPPVAEERTGASSEPSGSGFSIQIAALGERTDADTLAKGLSSKGYTAYVLPPASGAPTVFRVRVGKFSSRREAESIASKLEKEEHFKPWITR